MIYLSRVWNRLGLQQQDGYTIHRLMGVAIMLASKLHDDVYWNNRTWAMISGIALEELNRLELRLMGILYSDLYVSREEYLSNVWTLPLKPEQVAQIQSDLQ